MSDLRTPDEWCRIKGLRVLDPDGWHGNTYGRPWDEPLDEDEFNARVGVSTVGRWDWDAGDKGLREALHQERLAADLHGYNPDSQTNARYEAARAATDAAVAELRAKDGGQR